MNAWGLRFPATLAGVLSVAFAYRLTLDLKLPVWAAARVTLIVATLPILIAFSQEARFYNLLTMGVLFATVALVKRKWGWLAVALILVVYTHNIGLMYAAVLLSAAFFGELLRKPFKLTHLLRPIGVGMVVLLAWLPSALTFFQQTQRVYDFWFATPDLFSALNAFNELTFDRRATSLLRVIIWVSPLALTAICGFTLLFIQPRRGIVLTVLVVFLVPFLTFWISIFWRPLFYARSYLPSGAGLALLWGVAINYQRAWRIVTLPILIVSLMIGLSAQYFPTFPKYTGDNVKSVILPEWREGDGLYFTRVFDAVLYSTSLDKPYRLRFDPNEGELSVSAKNAIGLQHANADELPAIFKRVWVIEALDAFTTDEQRAYVFKLARCGRPHTYFPPGFHGQAVQIWLVDWSAPGCS